MSSVSGGIESRAEGRRIFRRRDTRSLGCRASRRRKMLVGCREEKFTTEGLLMDNQDRRVRSSCGPN
jgi:hypothetical protein